jgi:hypothetical protein
VEETHFAVVLRTMKPSSYAGYKTYFERYIKPRAGKYAVRDFTVAIVFAHAEGFTKPDPTKPMSRWRSAWRSQDVRERSMQR